MELTFPHVWVPRDFNREKRVVESRIGTPGAMSGGMQSLSGVETGLYGANGPPADAGSPAYSWWADLNTFSDDSHSIPATNGGVVATWGDRIAGVYLAQATNGNRPLLATNAHNGRTGIAFDGSDDRIGQSFSLATAFTEFLVLKATKDSNIHRILCGTTTSTFTADIKADNSYEMDTLGGGPSLTAGSFPSNTYLILCNVWNGSNTGDTGTRTRVNADTASTSPNIVPSTGSVGGRFVGNNSTGTGNPTAMTLLAYVIYASALGTSAETDERNVLNGWYAIF